MQKLRKKVIFQARENCITYGQTKKKDRTEFIRPFGKIMVLKIKTVNEVFI